MNKIFHNNDTKKYLIVGSILVILYWALNHLTFFGDIFGRLTGLMMPFILGGVIAFILNVPMRQIENKLLNRTILAQERFHGLRRGLAFFLTLLLLILIITLAMFVVIPQLVETIGVLFQEIPLGVNRLIEELTNQLSAYPDLEQRIAGFSIDWDKILQKLIDFASTGTKGIISGGFSAVNGIISGVTTFVIGFVFSIYLLFQKETLSRQCKKILYALCPQQAADRCIEIMKLTNVTFSNFLSGQCLEAVILGTMFCITMLIIRLPYAFLIGVLIAITALIPIVGAFIGCFIGIILIGLTNPIQAVVFLVMFLVLQQIEGNLIYPHVVGNSVGLPSIWVLVAVTLGGNLFGIMGMLTFIPICSVLYALFRVYINRRLAEKNSKIETIN